MSEEIKMPSPATKEQLYNALLPQIEALVGDEQNLVANLANVASALKFGMEFFWVGFYLVDGEELVLGPFQGTPACTRIQYGAGVCGTAWKDGETLLVKDVEQFPGHIACSAQSKSEIVVPIRNKSGKVALVLDVDSTQLNDFDQTDQIHLEKLADFISTFL